MSVLTVRIPDELETAINKFCKIEDRTKSWLVKKALQEKMDEWQSNLITTKTTKESKKITNKAYIKK